MSQVPNQNYPKDPKYPSAPIAMGKPGEAYSMAFAQRCAARKVNINKLGYYTRDELRRLGFIKASRSL